MHVTSTRMGRDRIIPALWSRAVIRGRVNTVEMNMRLRDCELKRSVLSHFGEIESP